MGVGTKVGVLVGVGVDVYVEVEVGLRVGVCVDVDVEVDVNLRVGMCVDVGVGANMSSSEKGSAKITTKPTMTTKTRTTFNNALI